MITSQSTLSTKETSLHEYAIQIARRRRQDEGLLVQVLDEIDACGLYRTLGYRSLFSYAVLALDLCEGTAYAMINIARKSRDFEPLREAVFSNQLSISKAAKIVSTLDQTNAAELIEFAKTHTSGEIELEVARRRRQGDPQAEEKLNNLPIPVTIFEKLKRVQSVLSTKRRKHVNRPMALEAVLDEFLDRHDPVRQADRAVERRKKKAEKQQAAAKSDSQPIMNSKGSSQEEQNGRKRKTAEETHTVNARDRGRCQFVDANGKQCDCDRWIHVHHKLPVSLGGSNDPENLVSLCPFHHDLVHQLSLPIDGQANWIRESTRAYH